MFVWHMCDVRFRTDQTRHFNTEEADQREEMKESVTEKLLDFLVIMLHAFRLLTLIAAWSIKGPR